MSQLKEWSHIVGHQNIVDYLQQSLDKHRFAHAYLFWGPESVGKSALTECFAGSLLCTHNQTQPCNDCQACQQFSRGIHPDYYELDVLEDKKRISIQQVREWQSSLSRKSFLSKYQVGVVKQADKLTLEASNALLKTIEEPSSNTIIILQTSNLHLLLPTIISRSQRIKFSAVRDEDIYNYLLEQKVDRATAKIIARLSRGLPGQAINFWQHAEQLEDYKSQVKQLVNLLNSPEHKRLEYTNEFTKKQTSSEQSAQLALLLDQSALIMRDVYLQQQQSSQWSSLNFCEEEIQQLAEQLKWSQVKSFMHSIHNLRKEWNYNPNTTLRLEELLLSI